MSNVRYPIPWDVDNTARFLNVSPRTVRRWVKSGKLKGRYCYPGDKILISESSARALQKEREESGHCV